MLTEERYNIILDTLRERRTITVAELTGLLGSSESTIRRDLTALDEMGQLKKVHGGATAIEPTAFATSEYDYISKQTQYGEEKHIIGVAAARLITAEDFVYIDAGTTTEALVSAITETGATYITNGLSHAQMLLRKGCRVFVPGGRIRPETEAIVGADTLETLKKYHFTLGFFGTNGITAAEGFTTPDVSEARIKQEAFGRSRSIYVLADASKFNRISPVTFGPLKRATIITNKLADERYREYTKIMEAEI